MGEIVTRRGDALYTCTLATRPITALKSSPRPEQFFNSIPTLPTDWGPCGCGRTVDDRGNSQSDRREFGDLTGESSRRDL